MFDSGKCRSEIAAAHGGSLPAARYHGTLDEPDTESHRSIAQSLLERLPYGSRRRQPTIPVSCAPRRQDTGCGMKSVKRHCN